MIGRIFKVLKFIIASSWFITEYLAYYLQIVRFQVSKLAQVFQFSANEKGQRNKLN